MLDKPRTSTSMLAVAGLLITTHAASQVTFYEREGFRGEALVANGPISNFNRSGFNDRASSAIVERGRWEVCEHTQFNGPCVVLRPGNYPSLESMQMNNSASSVRPVGRRSARWTVVPPPEAAPVYDYRRRPNERLYQVSVSSVRAVVGPPEQRCWVERQEVVEPSRDSPNVPGAVVGAIIGGVLGHQIGGGRGQDIATTGGAVAGAAIGANTGRNGGAVYSHDVQRCADLPYSARPAYWDVTYHFRGQEHRVQLNEAPGPTLWVNGRGEPRG